MRFALGFRIKSGQALVVALGGTAASPLRLVSTVVALSDPAIPETKQPHHAGLRTASEGGEAIERLVAIVRRCARASIDALFADDRLERSSCSGAALVVGSVIDPERVGNPHIRAHAREGRLFREVVEESLRARQVKCTVIVEKSLAAEAARALGRSADEIKRTIAALGRGVNGPWRADEKAAATAAWYELGIEN
jgi:hypothetical protein